jgi:cholesterol transport system auxiliary component
MSGGPTLFVAPVRAGPALEGTAMLYTRGGHEIGEFARHRWAAPPARLLLPLLVGALESSGRFAAVVTPPVQAPANYRLDTELLAFEQDFSRVPSEVRLTLRATLTRTDSGRTVARSFEATVAAASDDPRGGVEAANQAVHRLLTELAGWVVAQAATP